ncbi:hypothetical protein JOM56_000072 [Amanita muscaria]
MSCSGLLLLVLDWPIQNSFQIIISTLHCAEAKACISIKEALEPQFIGAWSACNFRYLFGIPSPKDKVIRPMGWMLD